MPKNWDDAKVKIHSYYIDEKRSLEEVRRLMKENYQFEASTRAYKSKIVKWRFFKNSRRSLRAAASRAVTVVGEVSSPTQNAIDGTISPIYYLPTIASSNPIIGHPTRSESETLTHTAPAPVYYFDPAYPATQTSVLALASPCESTRAPNTEAIGLNTRDASGKTRLHHAVIRGDLVDVDSLLSTGASLDVQDDDSYQPIHYAARGGFDGIIQNLLKSGADVNAQGPQGKTPTHLAIRSLRATRSLLKFYPTLSSQDNQGNTALHTIFLSTSLEHHPNAKVLEKLLEAGANTHTPNNSNLTPIHLAIDPPDPLVKPYLLLAKLLLQNSADLTLVETYSKPLLERLLDKANINWNDWNETPKNETSSANTICKLLLRKGASPNVRLPPPGELLLHTALRNSQICNWDEEFLIMLCETADIESVSLTGDLPLHSSIRYAPGISTAPYEYRRSLPTTQFVEILVKRGANLNQRNSSGDTPLMVVLKRRFYYPTAVKFIKSLLQGGADLTTRDRAGDQPIFVAMRLYKGAEDNSLLWFLVDAIAKTYPRPYMTPENFDEFMWWTEYSELLHEKHWHSTTHTLATASFFPDDIRSMLSKMLLTIAARKTFPSAQTQFTESKNEFGLDHPDTQSARDQIVLILRDCKTLDLDIDKDWYQFLLELFPPRQYSLDLRLPPRLAS